MITRFDHLVVAVRDLTYAEQLFRDQLGLEVYAGGQHTGRGTHNAIVRFGLDYVELLGVLDEEEARRAGKRRAALVDYLAEHEGGLAGFCLATSDIEALAASFQATGLEAYGPFDMERARPDGVVLRWRLLVPCGMSWRRPWPFFIQWQMSDAERIAVETPGRHSLGVERIASVAVVVRDLEAARHLYAHHLGLPLLDEEVVPDLVARCARFALPDGFVIDLFAPDPGSPLETVIASEGEGLYEVVLAVEDMAAAADRLAERGMALLPARGQANALQVSTQQTLGARIVIAPSLETA